MSASRSDFECSRYYPSQSVLDAGVHAAKFNFRLKAQNSNSAGLDLSSVKVVVNELGRMMDGLRDLCNERPEDSLECLVFDFCQLIRDEMLCLLVGHKASSLGGSAEEGLVTWKQFHVLRLMGAGKTKEEVAEILGVSLHTVNYHLGAIRKAFNVKAKSVDLVVMARQRGII